MASAIELLVPELLDAILENMKLSERVCLLRCSKYLHCRIEPLIYGSKSVCNDAMFWACKHGSQPAICLAVSYGAYVSTVEVKRMKMPGTVKVLTLHLAARKGHVDAFSLLLDLGARIPNVEPMQLRSLLRRLSRPIAEVILRRFLQAGLFSDLKGRSGNSGEFSLVRIIRGGASLDLVSLLLDYGVSLNRPDTVEYRVLASPLTAAIMVNSGPIVDLLLERGADIHGKDTDVKNYGLDKPLHIPIFAAAQTMEKHGFAMMQLCLDKGADINSSYRTRIWPGWMYNPLLAYVNSIRPWNLNVSIRPAEGLTYFLGNGAELESSTRQWTRGVQWFGIKPPPLELLLYKFQFKHLSDPVFFRIIKFLVEKDCSRPTVKSILSRTLGGHSHGDKHPDFLMDWKIFLDLLLKQVYYQHDRHLVDYLLRSAIWDVGRQLNSFSETARFTIERLWEAGGYINLETMIGFKEKGGNAMLHRLTRRNMLIELDHVCQRHTDFRSCGHAKRRLAFFSLLAEKGSDVTKRDGDGQTPIDVLLKGIDSVPENGKQYLLALAAVLQRQPVPTPSADIVFSPKNLYTREY
ncbi:hypothetical protein G7Y89_g13485 [Cudoniella acicularis]|uniref:Ankyrin n=1 Tax=Cudoniella acicularis TaxID=354080 RepID=A0A8H4R861_9HELO|nr:hypothetical protein G7Y89_g13485 [Cudoniella acicularis]